MPLSIVVTGDDEPLARSVFAKSASFRSAYSFDLSFELVLGESIRQSILGARKFDAAIICPSNAANGALWHNLVPLARQCHVLAISQLDAPYKLGETDVVPQVLAIDFVAQSLHHRALVDRAKADQEAFLDELFAMQNKLILVL
jgi:hypothetical protein